VVTLFFLVLASFRGVYAGDEIRGSADLSYRATETKTAGEKEYTWMFDQVYNLGLTKELTSKVDFTGDLGINITETDHTKTTRLYPDMRLNVSNEYFSADTGYRSDERGLDILTAGADEERATTESWNTNFYTRLEKYPKVRLRYNQDKNYDHLAVHQTNTQTDRFSGSADYAFRFLNFYYDYTNEISDNYVEDSTGETDTHDARIDFRKSIWSNRITSYGSYSINERTTETTARGSDISSDIERTATTGWYGVGTSPTAVPAAWTEEPELTDKVFGDPSVNLNVPNYQNIRIDLTQSYEAEKIYVYTTPDRTIDKTDFSWAVYFSADTDFTTWTSIPVNGTPDYDADSQRFEILFDKTTAQYFRVVNTANDLIDLYVTEIEAYGVTSQPSYSTTEDVTTTETILANLAFRPFDWLSFTYDLNQGHRKNKETGADTTTTRTETRRIWHDITGLLGKGFQVHKYLEVLPQYERRLEYEDDTQTEPRTDISRSIDTFRVRFVSSPLETLDTDLSLNHWVLQEESKTESRTSSALLHIAAELREGADLDIDGDITRSENLLTKSESLSRSIHSNLRLELTSVLTTEIEYNMNRSDTETPTGDTTSQTSDAEVTFYWRPSHDFYFRASYGVDRDEELHDETTRQNYNLNWLLTKKAQLSMDYAIDRNDTDKTSFSSDLSWSLSQMFTFRFGYDWTRREADTETETETVSADLSARF
jgi:hypothetical protein